MNKREITALVNKQREFFNTGVTYPTEFRIRALIRLKKAIKENEEKIKAALYEDLGKCGFESYMCEIGMALSEISYMIKNVRRLSSPRKVKTPLAQFAAKSYQLPTPRGVTLIMSPWNYPFLLTVDPLCEAIAAGNTVILKPSAYSPATSAVVAEIIAAVFPQNHVAVVLGGREENNSLLEQNFDFVFFTGSQSVGKIVLEKCAQTLTPAVLELGGKSPCIVDKTAKIDLAARRIVFGKFLNCGQTCVAPDYLLVEESVRVQLIEAICREIHRQFGDYPEENENYGKIINQKHFLRLLNLIDKDKVIYGGTSTPETQKISPTVLDRVTDDDAVMGEEIFGPILPILTFNSYDEVIARLQKGPKPLALYIFTEDKKAAENITRIVPFGGGCINDVVIHLATEHMGFGGVGESGMGSYHGDTGFDTFSHIKSIVDKKTWIDLRMRYRPYGKLGAFFVRKFLK